MNPSPSRVGEGGLFSTFWLGDHWFGIDARLVKEVSADTACAPIPHAPPAVVGYVNLRGHLYLAIDARQLLGIAPAPGDCPSQLIVFKPAAGEAFGILVDRAGDIVPVDGTQIEVPVSDGEESSGSSHTDPSARTVTLGVARLDKALLTIVDPVRILPLIEQELTQA